MATSLSRITPAATDSSGSAWLASARREDRPAPPSGALPLPPADGADTRGARAVPRRRSSPACASIQRRAWCRRSTNWPPKCARPPDNSATPRGVGESVAGSGAWTGPAGGSCHDAVQQIYPDVWIMHDAVSGVERTLGEWSFLLADYQRSRTSLEAQAVEARAAVGRAKDNPDLSIGATVIWPRVRIEELEGLLRALRRARRRRRTGPRTDSAVCLQRAAQDLKKQRAESAKAFGGQDSRLRRPHPLPATRRPARLRRHLFRPCATKPPPRPWTWAPSARPAAADPTAKDRAALAAPQLMVAGQDAYFDNDRAASYMKNWLEGDGQDVRVRRQELVNADPRSDSC
ncbi:hypothetical protein ACU686_18680 [Yinghuangia aomiensis]